MITAIAAVSENWGIGRDNDLLFNIPEDKKFFRRTTLGHTVIMGRKTLESLPNKKPFKDRRNIILSRDTGFSAEGAEVAHSVNEVLNLVKDEDAFVVGGGEIYREFLCCCAAALITKVNAAPDADVFFPDLDKAANWKLTEKSEEYTYEGLKYTFCKYDNHRDMDIF